MNTLQTRGVNFVEHELNAWFFLIVVLNTDCYKLIGVDLNDLSRLEELLRLCRIKGDNPTLLLSECVLTYMTAIRYGWGQQRTRKINRLFVCLPLGVFYCIFSTLFSAL